MQNQRQDKFRLLSISKLSDGQLEKCADLYCQIWKEPPWNEDFWTVWGTLESIREDMSKNIARGFVVLSATGEVIGFTWGYGVSIGDMREISGNNGLDHVFRQYKKIFYIAELGVSSYYRGYGLGKRLTKRLIASAKFYGVQAILLRTDIRAIPARRLYDLLGFIEMSVTDGQHETRTYWLLIL